VPGDEAEYGDALWPFVNPHDWCGEFSEPNRLFLLGIAIAAAVGGVHFLSQAIDHLTGRP